MNLALKYRPLNLTDVIGQEYNVEIIENQFNSGALKQAYLFSGSSGTGKTTVARILANMLKAEIIEIDGASNNSVNDIRDIREQCKYKSIRADCKVYIIDEAHMLSKGAFNALLKTLEEPPKEVYFILATTEPFKFPDTILSRCQKFQFNRISTSKIYERLKHICEQEHKQFPEEVLKYIAKISQGGMRKAIMILDTCINYPNISIKIVDKILGNTSLEDLIKLTLDIANSNHADVIKNIENLHDNGTDLKKFVEQFLEFIIELTKYAILGNTELTIFPDTLANELDKLLDDILEKGIKLREWYNTIIDINNSVKYNETPKILIQGGLLQLC